MNHTEGRLRFSLLGLIGVGLALALAAAVLSQARQFTLLRETVQASDDFAVLMIYQNEAEYLRLRELWRVSMQGEPGQAPDGVEELRLRYEIWVSRVGLLQGHRPQQLLQQSQAHLATVADMQAFVAQADRAFGEQASEPLTRGFLQQHWAALQALEAEVHRLSLDTSHRVAEQADARSGAVSRQSAISLATTMFLSVLALAFAIIALRQLAQVRDKRRELEASAARLRQSQRDAEAASAAKSTFLANMSHEIRTPFHGLMGMLSLLRETGLNARQVDYLRTATESADHLLAILNDILDMSQLEAGRLSLSLVPTELRKLLQDIEALMRPQAMAKGLALHIEIDPGLPEHLVLDPTRVKQVLFNLLANAVKFSERGTVLLEVRSQLQAGGLADQLVFVVSDQGPGMDAATLSRLFTRFGQGDSSPSRRHAGAGLGLEISRNLARLMKGDITVRSKPGEGSSFTFTLPLQEVPPPALAAPSASGEPERSGRTLRVLVAEDHPVNRRYLGLILESMGHEARFTTNGQEAVQAAREQSFDLVLMDLHMPVMDGIAATKAIRALPQRAAATVPIVALTADAFEHTRERCLVAGMNDFLSKPVNPQKLASSLRRLFGGPAAPAAGEARGESPAAPEAAPPVSAAAVIDTSVMHAALQAMPRERLAQLIDSFLEQGPQTVQRLRAAVRDAQPLELRVNAHAARGAALNLGLSSLAATAGALQEGAAHLPAHEIARLVQRYEELLPVTRQAVAEAGFALAAQV